ncbi:MAG: class I SAM-dependent methyltransferase [Bacillota bacterium]
MEDNNPVRVFYETKFNEDEREGRETLEFTRTKAIIARYLSKEVMEIADVCGATGAYSFWLAGMGHRVHLLDLARNHIELALEKSKGSGISLASYVCGDARCLPYENGSMDMVLLMGALYHLRSAEARLRCLKEAYRVLRPGGQLLCTVISRYVDIISTLKFNLFDVRGVDITDLEAALHSGVPRRVNLPSVYCHTPDGIRDEMTSAGFENPVLIAVEGIANPLGKNSLPDDETEATRLLQCIELTESIPDLLGVSRNIMAVGRKPTHLAGQ